MVKQREERDGKGRELQLPSSFDGLYMCSSTVKVVDGVKEELSGKFCETRVLILTYGRILISPCQEMERCQTDKKQYVDSN